MDPSLHQKKREKKGKKKGKGKKKERGEKEGKKGEKREKKEKRKRRRENPKTYIRDPACDEEFPRARSAREMPRAAGSS